MTRRIALLWLSPLALLLLTWTTASVAAAQEAAGDEPAAAESEKQPNEEFYKVPDGDVPELLAFIEKIRSFQPSSVVEVFTHRKMAGEAIQAAAEQILKKEQDKESEAYKTASKLLLQVEIGSLPTATPEQQADVYQRVKKLLAAEGATQQNFGLAYQTASGLEYGNNEELAAKAFAEFGEAFAKSDDEQVSSIAEKLIGASRRLRLPGNPIEVKGVDLAGNEFDWKSYRGKVVLIDFWATWCGPCRAELPNIKAVYDQYHDEGFDVVGISIDADRAALEDYVEENKLPWTTLHQNDGEGAHPTADYYGVLGIPTMILVGRDGKVLSTHARGETLKTLLKQQFEQAEETNTPAAGE